MLLLYLRRRARLTRNAGFNAIEEMDWFMHFMSEGLYFGDDEEIANARINLLSFTEPLDNYYLYAYGPRTKYASKPSMNVPPRLAKLLQQIEESPRPGWARVALMVLNLDAETHRVILDLTHNAIRRRGPASGRAFLRDTDVGREAIITYAAAAPLGFLRPTMTTYAKARMVLDGAVVGGVIGFYKGAPDTRPYVAFIDASREEMPSIEEAERSLGIFRSTLIPFDERR